ncbi:VOC family protein [Melittangium boletus]|uniref:PhnB-like domain-containing protein n=1 Tax=Melittangium boletus DSM 14713 TaxID=1294270 RepID=A0A250IPT5_9BACT|nr:VOC family protein [Melittangium boletus]ATB33769.1 hypothetical protein MEBOL_007267 [Melittangium boletus DSM 14713]
MKLINNLNFNGRCREAFEHYAEVLGGKLTAMHTFGEMPGNKVDAAWQGKIAHAWLQVGDQAIMGCDAPPEYAQPMGGFSVTLQAESTAEARRIFSALSEGGRISMPIGETPWSPCFGMLTDRFGTPWMIDTLTAQASS